MKQLFLSVSISQYTRISASINCCAPTHRIVAKFTKPGLLGKFAKVEPVYLEKNKKSWI